ncbi:MAG: ABC transporter substrate-binding protein, partial [Candidatus Hermodarchaeota archaeon]
WHNGYGYTNVSVTTEDINWIYRVLIRSDVINPKRAHFQDVFGTNGNNAFEIINSTTIRFHLRYPYAEALELFNVPILPRHILDPSYNSSPYGGPGVGFTADGAPILPYSDWSLSDFNRGTRGSNFTGPAVIGTGPFYFEALDSETHEVRLLENNYYFKDRGQNCPIEYVYRPIAKVSNAIAALAAGEVDILDASYHLGERTVYELLSSDSAYITVQTPKPSIHAFFYNLNNQYLKEKNVRLALSHIYGRDSPDYILGDYGREVSVPLPLDSPYYPSIPPLMFNITRAREFMAQAGYDTAILPTESETFPAFDPIMLFSACLILTILFQKRNRTKKPEFTNGKL